MANFQPALHELVTCVSAPSFALYPRDGQLTGEGVEGVFVTDRRILSSSIASIDAGPLVCLFREVIGADCARFVYTAGLRRDSSALSDEPKVLVDRRVEVHAAGASETFTLEAFGMSTTALRFSLALAGDLAELSRVRSGVPIVPGPASLADGAVQWRAEDGTRVTAVARPEASEVTPAQLIWEVELTPGRQTTLTVEYQVHDDPTPPVAVGVSRDLASWAEPGFEGNASGQALLDQSLADLRGLLLADAQNPRDVFLGAGSPWYLTLFGRDSLWAARLLLPLGTDLALGTLRTLARRQGKKVDPISQEQPGKILHELRRAPVSISDGRSGHRLQLPALYYGTVDATCLWVILLHDAWRAGLVDGQVEPLVDRAEQALRWMRDYGVGSSGFLEYVDSTGTGLANQGWKDSTDAVRFANGSRAEPPVALCEVQAYAYEAAIGGAALLRAFNRPGSEEWVAWADALAQRFRSRFWVDHPGGAFPAIALDARGRPADTLTSNIGHLLGTGLLDAHESTLVADRLGEADMDSGFGLRTLSASAMAYDPLSYHCGSVWAHDTAIAVRGLLIDGHRATATTLAQGLIRAATHFDNRMPELYGGQAMPPGRAPIPYATSCRPQAWSAAAVVHILLTMPELTR
ncbi:MAG: Amylo-alpha6-glucosidase [Pseudonocardiales bacterium]|nr:Amylo-alpha6-glucosidase [Pseudonocardiales bacterium]